MAARVTNPVICISKSNITEGISSDVISLSGVYKNLRGMWSSNISDLGSSRTRTNLDCYN